MPRRKYTRFEKWYGSLSLGFIAFFNNPIHRATHTTFSGTLLAIQQKNDRFLVGVLVTSLIFILGVAVVILGILNERLWAKWLAIGIYSLTLVMTLSALPMIISQINPIGFPGIVIFWLPALLQLIIPIFGIVSLK